MFALAQMVGGGWGFAQIAIAAIIVLAVVGILIVATRVMGVPIPQWVWQILGILLVAAVAILGIRFLMSL